MLDREQIILDNMPQVRQVARRMLTRCPPHVELADLVSAGMVGLIEAVDRYKPDLGVPFAGYAHPRIRGAILDWMRLVGWQKRQQAKSAPSIEGFYMASLSEPVGDEGWTLGDTLPCEQASALDYCIAEQERQHVRDAIRRLPARCRRVIELYHYEEVPMGEIARGMGVTLGRVSQIRTEGIGLLRQVL